MGGVRNPAPKEEADMHRLRRFKWLLLALLLTGCTAGGIYIPPTLPPLSSGGTATGQVAVIETNRGIIYCELRPDAAPKTVENFEKLANEGWYDGRAFFRVEPGSLIQGGSPDNSATGSLGYTIEAEIQLPHRPGALAMARTADQVNPERRSSASQFYISMVARPDLDERGYTVFGYCDESLDVVRMIQANDVMRRVRVQSGE
jgi:cyclophilin family peptidyl-prolyl cis-trans isomerase